MCSNCCEVDKKEVSRREAWKRNESFEVSGPYGCDIAFTILNYSLKTRNGALSFAVLSNFPTCNYSSFSYRFDNCNFVVGNSMAHLWSLFNWRKKQQARKPAETNIDHNILYVLWGARKVKKKEFTWSLNEQFIKKLVYLKEKKG